MFGAQFLPLKLGVFQDLLALHPDVFKRDELKVALGLHARSTRYLESVASGLPRHDLNGDAVEPVPSSAASRRAAITRGSCDKPR